MGEDSPAQVVRWVGSRTGLLNAALTGARSHVVTVGDHGFWSRQAAAVPATLAQVSSVRSFHVVPIAPEGGEPSVAADPLADMFYSRLVRAGYTQIARDVEVDGYRCDFVVARPDGDGTAVLLDRGKRADLDPARHLRLMFVRRRLLTGIEVQSDLPVTRVTRVVRVPAWRVRSGSPIPCLVD